MELQPLAIRGLRVRGIDLVLERPVETASGIMRTTPLVLLDLYTSEGVTGVTYVRCYTAAALAPLVLLLQNLESIVAGKPADPAAIAARLRGHFKLLGPQGLAGIAMAAIDMALWDAQAKAADLPLVAFLGGRARRLPAYASLRTMEPRAAAQEASERVAEGFRAIKLKIGRGAIEDDLAAIRAVRGAIGDEPRLMVDYNQSLERDEALERLRVLDRQGLYWIEEPLRADDFAGHATLAANVDTPIQLGENWWGPEDMEKSVGACASDHVMLDVMKLYGVSGWLRAAQIAQRHALAASSHTFPEISVHLLCVTPTAHYLEFLDHAGPVLHTPVDVRAGFAYPSSAPGAGITWDEAAIAKYGVA